MDFRFLGLAVYFLLLEKMKDGLFEVVAYLTKDESRLQEVELDGKWYFVAVPNEEYCVKVNIHKDTRRNCWPANYLRIGLCVDSVDVNYWKRLDLTEPMFETVNVASASFWGFQSGVNSIDSFKFSNLSDGSGSSSTSSSSSSISGNNNSNSSGSTVVDHSNSNTADKTHQWKGQFVVSIFEAKVSTGIFNNHATSLPTVNKNNNVVNNDSNNKFWKNPSVNNEPETCIFVFLFVVSSSYFAFSYVVL